MIFNWFSDPQLMAETAIKSPQDLMAEQRDRFARLGGHTFPRGYSRAKILNPDGSYSIKRLYTAAYRQYEQSDQEWKLYKVLYPLFLVLGALLSFFAAQSSPVVNNNLSHLLETLAGLPLLYLIYTMFYQISAPRRMKIRQYEIASTRMKVGAIIYGLFLALTLAAMLFNALTADTALSAPDFFCLIGQLLSVVLIFQLFVLEKQRDCTVVRNNLPDNVELID